MNRLLLALVLFAGTAVDLFAAYAKRLVHVLEQLRACEIHSPEGALPMVGGPAIGYAGSPHEFYLLFPYVSRVASEEDLLSMLADKSPVVRIMAATCILKIKTAIPHVKVDTLLKDSTKLCVAPYGCGISVQTVGEVITELKKNPDLFGNPKKA